MLVLGLDDLIGRVAVKGYSEKELATIAEFLNAFSTNVKKYAEIVGGDS